MLDPDFPHFIFPFFFFPCLHSFYGPSHRVQPGSIVDRDASLNLLCFRFFSFPTPRTSLLRNPVFWEAVVRDGGVFRGRGVLAMATKRKEARWKVQRKQEKLLLGQG